MYAVRRDDGAACDGPVRRCDGALRRSDARVLAFLVAICAVTIVDGGGRQHSADRCREGRQSRSDSRAAEEQDRRECARSRRDHGAPLGRAADDVASVQALLRAGRKANVANRNGITPSFARRTQWHPQRRRNADRGWRRRQCLAATRADGSDDGCARGSRRRGQRAAVAGSGCKARANRFLARPRSSGPPRRTIPT